MTSVRTNYTSPLPTVFAQLNYHHFAEHSVSYQLLVLSHSFIARGLQMVRWRTHTAKKIAVYAAAQCSKNFEVTAVKQQQHYRRELELSLFV